jgi:hypothetical protein
MKRKTFGGKEKGIGIFILVGLLLINTNVFSQDQNFYIYLCFGQSNMEGQGKIEAKDRIVNSRFKVMEAVECSNLGRKMGLWYTATPPLCRCWTGLSPSDYFGRTMVANLPDSIKVGVINVSVAGCSIDLFDKDNYKNYVTSMAGTQWMIDIINSYGVNPYSRLVDMTKLAQKSGVIKGILMHQGETNTGDIQWPSKVKRIYNNLITDLSLDPTKIPFLVGEVVNADQGGVCASMNSIIATLPKTIPNSYIISSKGCKDTIDNLHFSSVGYRELGKRYAIKMLSLNTVSTVAEDNTTSIQELEIYPNPASSMISLKNSPENASYSIFDTQGRKMNVRRVNNTMDVSVLSNGTYILRIVSNGKNDSKLFVKH